MTDTVIEETDINGTASSHHLSPGDCLDYPLDLDGEDVKTPRLADHEDLSYLGTSVFDATVMAQLNKSSIVRPLFQPNGQVTMGVNIV